MRFCHSAIPVMLLVFALGTLLPFHPVRAQQATDPSSLYIVRGIVTDSTGSQPLEGVTITVEGKNTRTSTDRNGSFTLNLSGGPNTLLFTSVGYEERRMTVSTPQSSLIVPLSSLAANLGQVIVVGYGTQKKATITGSVAAIKGEDLVTTKNENLLNMMTGKVPGVRIVQKSSEPGEFNNTFDIRGMGNPLIIIDGIPRDNITRLDGYDIESISVIKDATAAVYGVRAANGVVLITTRNGKRGKAEITYAGSYGVQHFIGFPETVNAIDYMTLMNEKGAHDPNNRRVLFTPADFQQFLSGTKQSSNWFEPVVKDLTPQHQHNISASGGTDKITYFMSLGYLNQQGLWKSNALNYKRYNFRSNVSAKVSNRLTAEMRISGTTDTKNAPNTDSWGVIRSLWRELPIDPIYANNNPAYPGPSTDAAQPLLVTDASKSGYKQNQNNWVQGSVSLTYEVPHITGLNAKALYSYDYYNYDGKAYQKTYSMYKYDAVQNTYIPQTANSPSSVNRSYNKNTATLMQLSLNYNHSFGKNNVSLLGLYEESVRKGDNFSAFRELALDALDQLFAGNSLNQTGSMDPNGLTNFTNKGIVGRAGYNYNQKYIAEFSFRRDGSSRFAPGRQWGFFPVGSVGWRISEEGFFRHSGKLDFVNNLKLRASYGKTGDDNASTYQFLTGYNYPSGGAAFNGNWVNGISSRGTPNPDITWFVAKTLNLGLDADLWNGKLGVQVDVFNRNRSGLLATRILSLPGTTGANLPQENLNSDYTSGFEIVATHKSTLGKVHLNLQGNFSYSRTKWKYVERGLAGNSYDNWRNNLNNRYNDIQWGWGYVGQFQSMADIYKSNIIYDGGGNRGLLPGDYMYQDWNGDGIIDDLDTHPIAGANLSRVNDVTTNVRPLINYGLTISAEYKGIDATILLQGTGRFNVQYVEALKEPGALGGNILTMFQDRWHPADPTADPYNPNTVWVPGHFAFTGTVAADNSERSVQNAAYVRIKTLELGYTLPKKWMKVAGLTNTRFYVSAYNLATWTKLKYLDPEHPADLYGYMYPLNQSYNVGLNITF